MIALSVHSRILFLLSSILFAQNAVAAINARIDASRLSGVAPLGVFFDATATTSTATGKPFHELHYAWDFGDQNAGQWQYGNPNSRNKNKAYGPVAAHVFETPGTYTVKLATKGLNGDTNIDTVTIRVTNPDTVFSGRDTTCFSTSGNFSGCPSGAARVMGSNFNDSYIGTRKRILFRKGETFTTSSRIDIDSNGPGLITSYGSGSRPTIQHSTVHNTFDIDYQIKDWRIVGLNFSGPADRAILEMDGETENILLMNNTNVIDTYNIAVMANHASFKKSGKDIPENTFIIGNRFERFGLGGAQIMFIMGKNLALEGNYLDDTNTNNGEHVVRITHLEQGVVSHNYMAHPLNGNKGVLTVRSADTQSTDPRCVYCGRYTRDVVVSDNYFFSSADYTISLVGSNAGGIEVPHGEDVIVERNFFSQSSDTPNRAQVAIRAANTNNFTIRNNIVLMEDWVTYRAIDPGSDVTNVYIFNNSCYSPDNASSMVRCVKADNTNTVASNNLLYAPNHSRMKRVVDGIANDGSNITASSNPFIISNINGPKDFKLNLSGAAIDAGRLVPVFIDYAAIQRTGYANPDVGAYAENSGVKATSSSVYILLLAD